MKRFASLVLALFLGTLGANSSAADELSNFAKRLTAYQSEVKMMRAAVRLPEHAGKPRTLDIVSRRIVDAEVNFSVKNYDDAAVVLYDIVEKHANHPSWDEALYYLSESLYQKKDLVGSRRYFSQLVRDVGGKSKFYQHSLERLIELTLKFEGTNNADEWLRLLDQIPAGQQRESVPYVRGKYEFFRGNHDAAIGLFENISTKSRYYLQARYFLATTHIAKQELDPALKELMVLSKVKPKNSDQGGIIELSHLARGRILYEQNQLSRAIDAYRQIPRQSELLDEVLYETAWVYVKNRNYEHALQALELLALSDPNSQLLPDVKILEGNLRIRLARQRLVNGESDGTSEYDQAVKLFEELRKLYGEPHQELQRVVSEHADTRAFLAQLTGRSSRVLDSQPELPEIAASWLREEAEVKKSISIEADLEIIETDMAETEETIERLERALGTTARINAFPALAEKRLRATTISEEIDRVLEKLAAAEHKRLGPYATAAQRSELEAVVAERKRLTGDLKALSGKAGAEERTQATRGQYIALDQQAAETHTVLENTRAELRALEKYLDDSGKKLSATDLQQIKKDMADIAAEVGAVEKDVGGFRRDLTFQSDSVGAGDDAASRAAELSEKLRQTFQREGTLLAAVAEKAAGPDRKQTQRYLELLEQAGVITTDIDVMTKTIYQMVDEGLAEIRGALAEERGKIAAYRQEYVACNDESRELGGEALALGFQEVLRKFADVLIRSDVGIADVAWSLHESADEAARRVSIEQARERKNLEADFADILREMQQDARKGRQARP